MNFSPLSLDELTRDTWGSYDPVVIAQLAPLADESCYQPKLYKAPDLQNEVIDPQVNGGYLEYGMEITPGSLIYGIYLPPDPTTGLPPNFTLQVEDLSLEHEFWDVPIPSVLVSNYKAAVLDPNAAVMSSFPNLLNAVYPVVGSGNFRVQIQSKETTAKRIEVVFGVLEVQ